MHEAQILELPIPVENLPAAQLSQSPERPKAAANLPAEQKVHTLAPPMEKVPGKQSEQDKEPTFEVVPPAHRAQKDIPDPD